MPTKSSNSIKFFTFIAISLLAGWVNCGGQSATNNDQPDDDTEIIEISPGQTDGSDDSEDEGSDTSTPPATPPTPSAPTSDPDVDDDGDGITENDGDCDDTNPAVNPYATEIFADGTDQDCDGYDFNPANHYVVSLNGDDNLPDGSDNLTCDIRTLPCKTIGHAFDIIPAGGSLIVLEGKHDVIKNLVRTESITIHGGFGDTNGAIVSDPETHLSSFRMAMQFNILFSETTTNTVQINNLIITGNAWDPTHFPTDPYRHLLIFENSAAILDNVNIDVLNGDQSGLGLKVSTQPTLTSDLSFVMTNSTIEVKPIIDTGTIALANAFTAINDSDYILDIDIKSSEFIISAMEPAGSGIAVGIQVEKTTSTTGSIDLEISENTIEINQSKTATGIFTNVIQDQLIRRNVISLYDQTNKQQGIASLGTRSRAYSTIRDNIIKTIGDASSTQSTSLFLGGHYSLVLNNTFITDSALEARQFHFVASNYSGKSAAFINNSFYTNNIPLGSAHNFYVQSTMQTDSYFTISGLQNNNFWNVGGNEIQLYYEPLVETDCSDTQDDDLDDKIDCQDEDCAAEPSCAEDCTNGLDDNGDGITDCTGPGENLYCRPISPFICIAKVPPVVPAYTLYTTIADVENLINTINDPTPFVTVFASNNYNLDPQFNTTDFHETPHLQASTGLRDIGWLYLYIDVTNDLDVFGNLRVQNGLPEIGAEELP